MFSPTLSDISQNNTEVLEKQQQEKQWRYKEEQQLLVQLKEVAKLCQAEHMAQKARREAKAKARKKAKRRKVVEEKKWKKRTLEYLQQLQDKVFEEDATLLESTEESQIAESKYKKVPPENDMDYWPSKILKENNQQDTKETLGLSWGVLTPVKDMYMLDRTAQYIIQGE